MTLDPQVIVALAGNPDALAAYMAAASVESAPVVDTAPAAAPVAEAAAPAATRDWSGYSPNAEKRGTLTTGALLYALNHAGLLTLRKKPGSPVLHGACFDIRNDAANAGLNWPPQRERKASGRK